MKEGRTKYNEPRVEEVEKRILEVSTVEKSGSFKTCGERDVLTKALGNPEHRGASVGFPRGRARRTWRPSNPTPPLTTRGRGTRKGSSRKAMMRQSRT